MSLSNQEGVQVQSIIGNKTNATYHVEIARNIRSMLRNQIARGQVRALSTKPGLSVLNPSAPHSAVPLR